MRLDDSAGSQDSVQTTEGCTVWLTGLPSAGKSTLARATAEVLSGRGRRVEVLDGDEIRRHLGGALGFDRAGRQANVRRIGWLAEVLARNGVTVLVAAIAPYAEDRREVQELHEKAGIAFAEVFVSAPVECCAARDVKGLYARQRAGEISGLTGVDDPYEVPTDPALRLETSQAEVRETVAQLVTYLTSQGMA
ncbi:adenylyl-sulfate kinase [Kribbella sp. NPDC056345]|uniref:adenylyl-sulfate kinase n=1 Tax=Kribbella sp. NPDC056345 TaxID=3345789 RepID=UPI0035DD9E5E